MSKNKQTKKSFKDYFVHACTVSACILACLCITATFCMWIPVTSKLGIIQSTKTLRQSLFQSTKGKQGKGNAEGFQLGAVWDVKSTFPFAASFSTTQNCHLMITKMPAHFLSYQLYLQSPYSYIWISRIVREEKEKRARSKLRESKWEGHHDSIIIIYICSLLISETV